MTAVGEEHTLIVGDHDFAELGNGIVELIENCLYSIEDASAGTDPVTGEDGDLAALAEHERRLDDLTVLLNRYWPNYESKVMVA